MNTLNVRFPLHEKLANGVVGDQRLFDLIPAEELAPLAAAYTAAKEAAAAAINIQPTADTTAAEVRAALREGKTVDVKKAFAQMAKAAAERAAHAETQAFFRALPNDAKNDLARLFNSHEETLYDGLAGQLDAVLDEAQEVVADLDGALDAEAAMKAGKTERFLAVLRLAEEYASIRQAHLVLLNAERSGTFGSEDAPLRPFAFFENPAAGYPDLIRFLREGTHAGGLRIAADAPFPLGDPTDRQHFLAALTSRDLLRPYVGRADEASAAYHAAYRAADPRAISASEARSSARDRHPHAGRPVSVLTA